MNYFNDICRCFNKHNLICTFPAQCSIEQIEVHEYGKRLSHIEVLSNWSIILIATFEICSIACYGCAPQGVISIASQVVVQVLLIFNTNW